MALKNFFNVNKIVNELESTKEENLKLRQKIDDLEKERIELLRKLEKITVNLVSNPTTVVEETGKSLVGILKEANRASREITSDMSVFNRDLQMRLDLAREKIDSLHQFLIIAARKIGNFEGLLKSSQRVEISCDELIPLVTSWAHYESALMKRISE